MSFASQDSNETVDDSRKLQVGRAMVYVRTQGSQVFPDGTIVRPMAENQNNGVRIRCRSDADGSVGYAFSGDLTVTASQQVAAGN